MILHIVKSNITKRGLSVCIYSVPDLVPVDLILNDFISERLAEDHIRTWSNEGDLVLAPFDKDGTVAKIAPLLERRWLSLQNAADCDGLRDNAG